MYYKHKKRTEGYKNAVISLLLRIAEVGVEPTRPLRARDFKSPASAIPPLGPVEVVLYVLFDDLQAVFGID